MNELVVFCTPPSPTHRTAEENLGIGYLAAMLRQEKFDVRVIDGWLEGYSIDEISQLILSLENIKVLGISAYRSSLEDIRNLILALRNSGFRSPIVAGGFGPTFYDEDFLKAGVDVVLRGEGEAVFPRLVANIEQGEDVLVSIPGLSWLKGSEVRRTGRVDAFPKLDDLPFPSRDTLKSSCRQKNPIHVATSRGCLGRCTFCAVAAFGRTLREVGAWRGRSVENIVEEISSLNSSFGISCFKFVDDSFIEPPRDEGWAEAFKRELSSRKLSIRFRTQIRADRLTPKMASTFASAGWFATSVGVESGSPTALKRMLKRSTVADNLRTLKILEENKIYTQMGLILFDDKTTIRELEENYEFLNSLRWPVTKGIFTEMYASEGTVYSKIISRQYPLVTRGNQGSLVYPHSSAVQLVYEALKEWHRSHSGVYDRVINPISAPKVIPQIGYSQYHELCLRLYDNDVRIFGEVLKMVKSGLNRREMHQFIQQKIRESEEEYSIVGREVSFLDNLYGLTYDAKPNPFL